MAAETQCYHITGFRRATFPQYGEMDHLLRGHVMDASDDPFSFCPLCGVPLKHQAVQDFPRMINES